MHTLTKEERDTLLFALLLTARSPMAPYSACAQATALADRLKRARHVVFLDGAAPSATAGTLIDPDAMSDPSDP